MPVQEVELRLALDSFGHDADAQAVPHGDRIEKENVLLKERRQIHQKGSCVASPVASIHLDLARLREYDPRFYGAGVHIRGGFLTKLGQSVAC